MKITELEGHDVEVFPPRCASFQTDAATPVESLPTTSPYHMTTGNDDDKGMGVVPIPFQYSNGRDEEDLHSRRVGSNLRHDEEVRLPCHVGSSLTDTARKVQSPRRVGNLTNATTPLDDRER